MRIVVIGQAAFGEKVLEALLERSDRESVRVKHRTPPRGDSDASEKRLVVGVFTPPDRPGGRPDPLKEAALRHGIPLFQPRRLADQEAMEAFKGCSPDLGIMAFVTDRVPEAILLAPTHGTIQYHPSLLPKHRGPSSINWPIIFGESRTGLTIFWPDAGLDTGPILLQKEVEIGPDDTVGSLYFGRLFPMGVDAMMEAVDMVEKGAAPRIPQDESQATYEGWCREAEATIDWARPVGEVYNLIRGTNPQPGAATFLRGQKVKVFDSEQRLERPNRPPGEVVELTPEGFVVATQEGAIHVKRVQPEGSPKIPAPEYVAQVSLEPGHRFGQ